MGIFSKFKKVFSGKKEVVGYMRCGSCGTSYTVEEDKLNEEDLYYRCDCGNEIHIPFFIHCKTCNEIVAVTQCTNSQLFSEIASTAVQSFLKPWTALKYLPRVFDSVPSANGWGICPFCNTYYLRCPNCNNPVEVRPGTDSEDVLYCPDCGQKMRHP